MLKRAFGITLYPVFSGDGLLGFYFGKGIVLTSQFPDSELYGLTCQIRLSAVWVASNIAEGYGRFSKNEYIPDLHISLGSLRETPAMASKAVGYNADKNVKGRKRFLTVDTLGLVLRVLITAPSVGEREGGKQVLKKVKQMKPTYFLNRL